MCSLLSRASCVIRGEPTRAETHLAVDARPSADRSTVPHHSAYNKCHMLSKVPAAVVPVAVPFEVTAMSSGSFAQKQRQPLAGVVIHLGELVGRVAHP